jgi:hypothetical protein
MPWARCSARMGDALLHGRLWISSASHQASGQLTFTSRLHILLPFGRRTGESMSSASLFVDDMGGRVMCEIDDGNNGYARLSPAPAISSGRP